MTHSALVLLPDVYRIIFFNRGKTRKHRKLPGWHVDKQLLMYDRMKDAKSE
jgi:hypothetical protein